MNTDGKITINQGDTIEIEAQNRVVTGKVITASYWGQKDGWYIELDNANVPGGYSYWKQGQDGGRIVAINGKQLNKQEKATKVKKYLVELRAGGSTFKMFENAAKMIEYIEQNRMNNPIVSKLVDFQFRGIKYYISFVDYSTIYSILTKDFSFVTKFDSRAKSAREAMKAYMDIPY